ncbi:hypothetical protein LTR56_006310 [Elasticomyces elasticus]|nr:hypothetical protein LTR56_006310 [Elasticomyces elasticus]KAK3663358.1 hypothetical protein LTR22_005765 [Elasticomyces elasticus]KAK4925437.1 hypothetical protein LTR49_007501 [Elasticomyces elasticus]KAK5764532.1 hypothetical protein LTS12_005262 [Elasticomyces elasticus]
MEQLVKVSARGKLTRESSKHNLLEALGYAVGELRIACDRLVSMTTLLLQPHHAGNTSKEPPGQAIDLKAMLHEVESEQSALYAVDDTLKLKTLSCDPPNLEAMRVAGGSTIAATHQNAHSDNDRSGSQPCHGLGVECSAQSASLWMQSRTLDTVGLNSRAPISASQAQENWALALRWDVSHKTVAGLVVGFREEDFKWIERHQHRLETMTHALQIPLLLIEAVFARDSVELKSHGQALLDIEAKTRLYVWATAESSGRLAEVDFDGFTKTLNGTTSRLAFHEMRIEGLRMQLNRLLQYVCTDESAKDGNKACRADIDLLVERAQSLKQIVTYHQRVAQNLVDVVYTMLSQRDNHISHRMNKDSMTLTQASVSLARTAKADSSAMKTLALIGTIFLPGTFLSALFSVDGMFNWNAEPGQNVVGHRFWIYWAFTIPITICVVAYFVIFVLVSDKHDMPKKGKELEEKLVGEGMQRPDPETPFQRVLRRRTARLAEHEKADMA